MQSSLQNKPIYLSDKMAVSHKVKQTARTCVYVCVWPGFVDPFKCGFLGKRRAALLAQFRSLFRNSKYMNILIAFFVLVAQTLFQMFQT